MGDGLPKLPALVEVVFGHSPVFRRRGGATHRGVVWSGYCTAFLVVPQRAGTRRTDARATIMLRHVEEAFVFACGRISRRAHDAGVVSRQSEGADVQNPPCATARGHGFPERAGGCQLAGDAPVPAASGPYLNHWGSQCLVVAGLPNSDRHCCGWFPRSPARNKRCTMALGRWSIQALHLCGSWWRGPARACAAEEINTDSL